MFVKFLNVLPNSSSENSFRHDLIATSKNVFTQIITKTTSNSNYSFKIPFPTTFYTLFDRYIKFCHLSDQNTNKHYFHSQILSIKQQLPKPNKKLTPKSYQTHPKITTLQSRMRIPFNPTPIRA